jgi:hypothetical protein
MGTSRLSTEPHDSPLAIIRAAGKALIAWVDLQEREQSCGGIQFYTSKSYPFGARRFRRDIVSDARAPFLS